MKLVFVFLASVLALPGPVISAQQSPALRRDMQAIRLLQQCSATMGSPQAGSTVVSSGTIVPANPNDPSTPVVLKSKGDSNARWELSHVAGVETVTLQGGHGIARRNTGQTSLPSWHTKYARQEHYPALLCSLEAGRPNVDIFYVGLEALGNSSVHHIQISAGAPGKSKAADAAERVISDFHIFIDAQSFAVVKTMRYAFSPDALENHSVFESYYSNYKPVAGISMPFTITNYIGGQKVQSVTFDQIELNVAVPDSEFNQ